MIKRWFIPLQLAALLLACETVVDIDIPRDPAKLVVNSTLVAGEYIKVHLSESQHILDAQEIKNITGASIDIFEDDKLLTTLPDSANGYYISALFKPLLGKTYRLEASKNGYENASAEVYLPLNTAEILSVKLDSVELKGDFNELREYARFSIEIKDNAALEDFYEIAIVIEYYSYIYNYSTNPPTLLDSIFVKSSVYLESNNLELDENQIGGRSILFKDDLFNGKNYTINLLVNDGYYFESIDYIDVSISLIKCSESYYLYELSSLLQQESSGNPFAQPVQVYNNITNGYGILGAYNEVLYKVPL